jgi:dihydroneopterin aldolase
LTTDAIVIRELEVWYCVGVPEAERAKPQRLAISIEMFHDASEAALADDLTRTIDYFAVSQRLLRFGEGRSWKLIETLASDVAELILHEFGAERVAVEVQKFIIPQARCVAVRVTRSRSNG